MDRTESDEEADWALIGAITGHLHTEIDLLLASYAKLIPERLVGDVKDKLCEMKIWFNLRQKFSSDPTVPSLPSMNDYRSYVCREVPGRLAIARCAGRAVEELLNENFCRDVKSYRAVLDKVKE